MSDKINKSYKKTKNVYDTLITHSSGGASFIIMYFGME